MSGRGLDSQTDWECSCYKRSRPLGKVERGRWPGEGLFLAPNRDPKYPKQVNLRLCEAQETEIFLNLAGKKAAFQGN